MMTTRTLSPEFYYDQHIFELEKTQLFPSQLFCVGHASNIAKENDFERVTILSDDILLCRQPDARACLSFELIFAAINWLLYARQSL